MPLFRAIIARRKVSSLLLSILTINITKGLTDLFIDHQLKWKIKFSFSNLAKSRLEWLNQSSKSLPKIISLSNVYFPFSISIRLCGLYDTCSEMVQRNFNKGLLSVFVLIILNIFVAGVCKYFLPNTSEHWGWLSSGRRGARFGLRCPFGSRTRRAGGRPEGPAQFGHNLGNAIDRKQRNTC